MQQAPFSWQGYIKQLTRHACYYPSLSFCKLSGPLERSMENTVGRSRGGFLLATDNLKLLPNKKVVKAEKPMSKRDWANHKLELFN